MSDPQRHPLDVEKRINNVFGEVFVLKTLVQTLVAAHPRCQEIIELTLQNVGKVADAMLATEMPESVLASIHLQTQNLQELAKTLRERDVAAGLPVRPGG